MLKKLATVTILSVLVIACGSTNKKAQTEKITNKVEITTADVDSTVSKPMPLISKSLILEDMQFSEGIVEDKIKAECKMLASLSESILTNSERYPYQLITRKDVKPTQHDSIIVKVDYIDVVPQKFSIWAIHPVSVATLKVSLIKDDKELKSATKEIGTKVAWGTCDRLEKIAKAGGKFVAKWTANQIH